MTPPPPIAYIEAGKLHLKEGNRPHGSGRDELHGLAETIRQLGILHPLIISPHPRRDGHYVIEDGNRRYAAGQIAGLGVFPCTMQRLTPAARKAGPVLTEVVLNTQRAAWKPVEFALKLGQLRDKGLSVTDIAGYTGLSQATISYHLELLDLDAGTLADVRDGKLPVGAAHDAVKAVRAAAPPPRPKPTVVTPRRSPSHSRRKPRPYFDATHPLSADAHALCTSRQHPAWERLNKVACGPCWDDAIVTNALSRQQPQAPAPAQPVTFLPASAAS